MNDLYYDNTNAIQNDIRVHIKLQRKLAGHIFNIYIPTLCLVIIAGFTLFIDYSHFDATIMVALTTMLVIYTLHQSISSTLPATAYLKMIDIWLFGWWTDFSFHYHWDFDHFGLPYFEGSYYSN